MNKLSSIIKSLGIESTRPSYWSGYGIRTKEMSSQNLCKMLTRLNKEVGNEAARAFIRMIEDVPMLKLTPFLTAVEKFEANDYKWAKKTVADKRNINMDDIPQDALEDFAMAAVQTELNHSEEEENARQNFDIKREFFFLDIVAGIEDEERIYPHSVNTSGWMTVFFDNSKYYVTLRDNRGDEKLYHLTTRLRLGEEATKKLSSKAIGFHFGGFGLSRYW